MNNTKLKQYLRRTSRYVFCWYKDWKEKAKILQNWRESVRFADKQKRLFNRFHHKERTTTTTTTKKIVPGQGAPNITTMLFLSLILPTFSHSVASTNYGQPFNSTKTPESNSTKITNFRQVCNVTNPRCNEQISSVPWHFVKSRVHCK